MTSQRSEELTVTLPTEQVRLMKSAIESGSYDTNSDIIRDALKLWEQKEAVERADLERLRRAYAEGIASGPAQPFDRDKFFDELKSNKASGG
ncbi:type II toxin-antitoxin system ParD family antitoxin [Fulvimarina sp. MAC8]|uniref:type II toxin-antitoxin system ParD family antitoxin n=1 Tax=Fulvimarina sp. MAC8 TaxID=3162874 RepID=UPI0032EE0884